MQDWPFTIRSFVLWCSHCFSGFIRTLFHRVRFHCTTLLQIPATLCLKGLNLGLACGTLQRVCIPQSDAHTLPGAPVACLGTAPFLFSLFRGFVPLLQFSVRCLCGWPLGALLFWLVLCEVVPFICSGWFVLLCGFCCLLCVLRRPVLRGRLCCLRVPLGFLLPFLPLPSFLLCVSL
jgi:hypothetical protein